MSSLIERLMAVHGALDKANLPHAFGGAIALGYCTQEPRGTRDLDINIFVTRARADDVFAALPEAITVTLANVEQVQRDGQTRLMWDDVPVDIFLNVLPFHDEVARGVRPVVLAGRTIPVLDCGALTVFKAMFDRGKDWVDIEAMVEYGSIDVESTASRIAGLDGADSRRAQRLRDLAAG
jgi:hypothetical protein